MPRRRRSNPYNLIITVIIIGAFALLAYQRLHLAGANQGPTHASSSAPVVAPSNSTEALPEIPHKPQPLEITFHACPSNGRGGDPVLNRLKNRVDEGHYIAVPFDSVEKLPWPPGIERKHHANWSAQDAAAVARYEGIPIAIEGYLADAREQGPESTNCSLDDHQDHDYHLWLTKSAGEDRSGSIVVEVTPRVRANHPNWTIARLESLAKNALHVRISGWLMLDPEHPEQLGKTRGTLWEIHPIMQIEVEEQGQWRALDSY